MALPYPLDVWREIFLCIDNYPDLLAISQSHPSFAVLINEPWFLRAWLNKAKSKVPNEFGDVGQMAYAYGDWTMKYILPKHQNASLRFKVEYLLARGCSANVITNGKSSRCGGKAGLSFRDEHTFSFDLLRAGKKICKRCLLKEIIFVDDEESLAYFSTFLKIYPPVSVHTLTTLVPSGARVLPAVQEFRHLEKRHSYYRLEDIDSFIEYRSAGLFKNFLSWRIGVVAKRGSNSELTIRALQHGARGFLELPGGPGRTRIAMEIAYQSIKEYEHNMLLFQLRNHPDIVRLQLHPSP